MLVDAEKGPRRVNKDAARAFAFRYSPMRDYFSLVTFSHTIFALPFAVVGLALGALSPRGDFSWWDFALVVACMVTARSAAMAFNRLVDADYDAANARTAVRDIPAGRVSRRSAAVFVAGNAALFVLCAGLLNGLCLALSPVALAVVLGYSYTKRFTWLCHLVLGVGLALAPIGAYVAVTGTFSIETVLLGAVVLTWVAGFDIVYALQDRGFDLAMGLNSVPTRFGESRSFALARGLHVLSFGLLGWVSYRLAGRYPEAVIGIGLAWVFFGAALLYQHRLVRPGDLDRIDRAFFTTNGVASVVFAVILLLGLLVPGYTH